MNCAPGVRPVVIVGGGIAALATAYELSQPGRERRRITVYVQGRRLGGKGASSRNESCGERIEEHGLHVWFGYYENAFRMLDQCYNELNHHAQATGHPRWSSALTTIVDAFRPSSVIGLADDGPDGTWSQWHARFPEDDLAPWDRDLAEEIPLFDLRTYLPKLGERITVLLHTVLRSFVTDVPETNEIDLADVFAVGDDALQRLDPMLARLFDVAVDAAARLRRLASTDPINGFAAAAIAQMFAAERVLVYVRQSLDLRLAANVVARRLMAVVDLFIGVTRGLLAHGITQDSDLDELDSWEMSDWLSANGVPKESRDSPIVRALTYCLPFSYVGGNRDDPSFSAGVGMRLFLRTFFTYRGALMWKMEYGMGEVVFAPLFELLVKRGVHFEFDHQLVGVDVDKAGPRISQLQFRQQREPAASVDDEGKGRALLRTLRVDDGRRIRVWPPPADDDESLVGISRTPSKTIECADADVVLAVPLEVLAIVGGPLFDASQLLRAAAEASATVPTLALQLWLTDPAHEALGWPEGITASGFTEPLDTFADMSHLTDSEVGDARGLVYLCSAFHDSARRLRGKLIPDIGLREEERPPSGLQDERTWVVREEGFAAKAIEEFLRFRATYLWPGARRFDGEFDLTVLHPAEEFGNIDEELQKAANAAINDPALPPNVDTAMVAFKAVTDAIGARLRRLIDDSLTPGPRQHLYFRSNVQPSDRYTLSLPGGVRSRVHPGVTGIQNLTVAGDWTNCVLNAGCIEAATISGMLAAEAIQGTHIPIIGRSPWEPQS